MANRGRIAVLILSVVTICSSAVAVEKEVETNSLKELRAQADKVLKQTNVSAREDIDVVFKLVDGLIEANQLEDAEKYITKGLEHFPWNLKYQMTYAVLLARLGRKEKAEEKATLVLQYGETGELIERARKLLKKDPLPEFPEISTLQGKNHCVVLVPLQECDKWLDTGSPETPLHASRMRPGSGRIFITIPHGLLLVLLTL